MLARQGDGMQHIVEDLAGAKLLFSILNDWETGGFVDKFPKEHWLLAAIRGNTGL